jgi:hypothetical protein
MKASVSKSATKKKAVLSQSLKQMVVTVESETGDIKRNKLN